MKIAEALDRARVVFLPNSTLRLPTLDGQCNKTASFIILTHGALGIITILNHSSDCNWLEQEEEILIKLAGISNFKAYDRIRCCQEPDQVVQEFLEDLKTALN